MAVWRLGQEACVFVLFLIVYGSEANPDAKRLYDDLLSSYNRQTRPVRHHNETVLVKLGLKLTQLINVDEKNQVMITNVWVQQEWRDYKLTWDPAEYGDVDVLYVPSQRIWIPDIVLYNNADGNYQVTLMTKAKVYKNGHVVWEPPAIYKSSCDINVRFFPFDEQNCSMKFGSWTYDKSLVDLQHKDYTGDYKDSAIDLSEFVTSVEWDLMAVPGNRTAYRYSCCPEQYVDITYNVVLRRKTLFYTVNFIIPCVALSFLTVCTFYLPVVSGEKISLSISILVSLTVFFLLLSETIPPTSLVVPLIGKYLLFTLFLVTGSVCVTVYVLNMHYRSPETHEMQPVLKQIFLEMLPRFLMMRRPEFEKDKTYIVVKESSKRLSRLMSVDSALLSRQLNLQKAKPRHPEIQKAMEDVQYIASHIQKEDELRSVKEDWQYVAMVLDRLFLWFFSLACISGTLGMMLCAPSIYDLARPIK